MILPPLLNNLAGAQQSGGGDIIENVSICDAIQLKDAVDSLVLDDQHDQLIFGDCDCDSRS